MIIKTQIIDLANYTICGKQDLSDLLKSKITNRPGCGIAGFHVDYFDYFVNHIKANVYEKHIEDNVLARLETHSDWMHKTIEQNAKVLQSLLPSKSDVYVFVFPTNKQFIAENMGGVNGYSPYMDTIHMYVDVKATKWKDNFKSTLAHEYNHAIFYENLKISDLLSYFVFEGLAEHFREDAMGGNPAPWSTAIPAGQAKEILNANLDKLEDDDWDFNNALMFGGDSFPKWAGYTIGYEIVKKFRSKKPNIKWPEIMITEPKKIFSTAGFVKNKY